ncbi:hydrogenase small subunit [Desulfosarcina sp.]|uniref:hydrogenase small subunit n=1 Tax=Desulfosarcina sp. TaxID=2027861 RepID=UPI0039709CB3
MLAHQISRRTFLKYCGGVAAALGLSPTMIPRIAQALTSDNRPPVIWLHFSECTGCSESFLRAADPDVAAILLDVLNVTYHETIQVACGEKAEYNRDQTVRNHSGAFICIAEGSIPTADNGVFGMVGGRTMLDIARSVIPHAKHTIAFGTCAAYGGLAAAAPNPTGAKGVKDAIGVNTINITGCPPHPINLVACVASYLLNNQMPALRPDGRPTFCHGETIHASCTVPHGCMEGYNCKGPRTYNNCHKTLYNQESWCVQAEHQCIGCSEPNFWDANAPFYNPMWASMFHTYRKAAVAHEEQTTASCNRCHGGDIFEKQESKSDALQRFQQKMHRKHKIDLDTNRSCANCHADVPGGTLDPFNM